VKTVNGEQQLQALVDGKKIVVTEASVRRGLQLDDEEGTDCLLNATIFEELTRMGYEKLSQKLTFYKAFFSPQWKFLIHTILQCLRKYFSGRETPLFLTMVVQAQEKMGEGSTMPTDPHHTPIITQPSSSQPQRKQKSRRLKRQDTKVPQPSDPINIADEAVHEEPTQEITSLKKKVKKLQKKGGSRTHKLKRLHMVGRSARVVSSEEASLGDQEDVSKHGRKIDDIDKDAEITLVDETQGRYGGEDIFRVNDLDGDEVVVESEVTNKAGEKRNIV
ncbi:hypothetical protein Tco_0226366, partial [Tanacetum coccineum]